jgi:hypothetical protein
VRSRHMPPEGRLDLPSRRPASPSTHRTAAHWYRLVTPSRSSLPKSCPVTSPLSRNPAIRDG